MKFEEIEVGKVYNAGHDASLYLVTHKGYNYIVVINYSTVHYVAVQQFYAKDYDYSEWYLEDEYYIEHYLSDTPQEYQRIFRVLNKMVVQGITDIDYFEI